MTRVTRKKLRNRLPKILPLLAILSLPCGAQAMAIDIDFYMSSAEYYQQGYDANFSLETADLTDMLARYQSVIRHTPTPGSYDFAGISVSFVLTDGIQILPVPQTLPNPGPSTPLAEPGTLGLMLFGLAALCRSRRRRG